METQLGTHSAQLAKFSTVIKLVNEIILELVRMYPEFIKFPKTTLETGAKTRNFCEFTLIYHL